MGFDLFDSTTVLDFRGTRYKGAEVRVRSDVSIEEYQAFLNSEDSEAEWTWFRDNVLVEWNLERKGEPLDPKLPRNKLPGPFIKRVIHGWMEAFVDISAPLVETSASGDDSPAP